MAGQQTYPDAAKLVRALRVIRAWADFDYHEGRCVALTPKEVVELCERTLAEWSESGGVDE